MQDIFLALNLRVLGFESTHIPGTFYGFIIIIIIILFDYILYGIP